jgi:hypothetical protein
MSCDDRGTRICLLRLAHARSLQKHGRRLNEHSRQCLACEKNNGSIEMATHKSKQVCDLCGQEKSCRHAYGMNLCSICVCVAGTAKKRPDVIRDIWAKFGLGEELPARTLPDLVHDYVVTEAASVHQDPASFSLPVNPFTELLVHMNEIREAKRRDYASNDDPLGNFREARRLGLTPLQGIMVRLTDKYTRACNLVRRNGDRAVKGESLADTLLDLANYSVLAVLIHNEMEEEHHAEDMSKDRPADTAGDLHSLPEEMSSRGEKEWSHIEQKWTARGQKVWFVPYSDEEMIKGTEANLEACLSPDNAGV